MKLSKFHYTRLLRSFSAKQEPDLEVVRHLINDGDWVVDIGANIGVYTKFLSGWAGHNGLVFSVEPVHSTFEILVANINHLQLKNVRPTNCAISESNSNVNMEIPLDERGLENHYMARIVGTSTTPNSRQIRVKSKTIDSLLAQAPHSISFLKIDTEGHELPCIKGALITIEKWQPALLIEISSGIDDTESEALQLVNMLRSYGYEPWWFDGKSLYERRVGDTSVNHFFLTSKHLTALEGQGILGSEEN